MTEHEYRSHPAISRSDLWKIRESPEKFKWLMEHPSEPTTALLFGQVVHKLLLEPNTFSDDFAIAPVVDKRTKDGKAEWERFLLNAEGKQIVQPSMMETALAMMDVAMANPVVADLLNGDHEVPFFWTDPDTQEPCKCRVDAIKRDERGVPIIVDYKSTSDASYGAFVKDVVKYGYYFQAAMYSDGVIHNGLCPRLVTGKPKRRWTKDPETGKRKYWTETPERIVMGGTEGEIIAPRFFFVVQEKTEPYAVNVFEMDIDFIVAGRDKFRELIGIYHTCKETGFWYGHMGPFNEPEILTLPTWMGRSED